MAEDERGSLETIDQGIRQLAEGPAEQAVADLTAVANRAIIELHKLARQEANRRRGEPDWGPWARLANAVRSGVLQIAAIRDSVKGLPAAAQTTPSATETPQEDTTA